MSKLVNHTEHTVMQMEADKRALKDEQLIGDKEKRGLQQVTDTQRKTLILTLWQHREAQTTTNLDS